MNSIPFAAAELSAFFPTIALLGFAIVLIWALLCIPFVKSGYKG